MEPMLNIALRAARKTGELIARASEDIDRIEVIEKGDNEFVSEIDQAAEREIIYHLRKAYPNHTIIAEESGENPGTDTEYQWIIDPLNGTANFLRGIPHYAVSIACKYRGQLEHAVVLDPIRREEFTASRGHGAQLNGRRIRVSSRKSLEGALLGTGIPYMNHCQQHISAYTQTLAELTAQTAGIRRAGAASLDMAYVATGRLDAFWEIGLQSWDIAAGTLLIREAGGLISDFSGGTQCIDSGNIVCGGPKCFKAVLQVTQPTLGKLDQPSAAINFRGSSV